MTIGVPTQAGSAPVPDADIVGKRSYDETILSDASMPPTIKQGHFDECCPR